jgi:hypothetical protein
MTRTSGFNDQGEYVPCNLLAGEFPRVERLVTIVSGQNLTRGSVLGKITASGKFTLSLTASGDGSEIPDAVLAEDIDASAGDAQAVVYFSGEFNTKALTLGAGHTIESISTPLRSKNINLRQNLSA